MRRTAFDDLSLRDKSLLLSEFGNFLMSIEFYDHRIFLYSLNQYFIEAYRNIASKRIEKISVASQDDLDKFLSQIILGNNYKKDGQPE